MEVAPGGGGGRERRRRQNARGYRAGHAEEEKERAIGLRVILPTSQKKIFWCRHNPHNFDYYNNTL